MDGGGMEKVPKNQEAYAFEEKVYESSIVVKGDYPKSSSVTELSGHSHAGHL